MKIAVFGCSNGLGHVRRIIAISCQLYRLGFKGELTAYVPISHILKMKTWHECKLFVSNKNIKIVDFCYPKFSHPKTESIYEKSWDEIDIPELNEYDVVWSDNITQIIGVREDTILTGTFLWYDVFSRNITSQHIEKFVVEQQDIIISIKPIMISNDYFATPEVRHYTNYQPVGLYRYDTTVSINNSNPNELSTDVLYACGLGGEEESITRDALSRIINKYEMMDFTLWVEPRILPKEYPRWIKKAYFSSDMFKRCKAAVIRPGIGTLSDVLAHYGRPFTFYNDNYEMGYNASILSKTGLGETCDGPYDAFEKAIDYIRNRKRIINQGTLCAHLKMEGVSETAEVIIQRALSK